MAERKRTKYIWAPILKKSTDADSGKPVVRYAFTSENMDEGGDIILRDATERATEAWRSWRNIRLQHDPSRPIGKAVKIGSADGLEWNQMDVRIDDPSVVPLVDGDDPTLSGASVGIIVNNFEVNDDEEARVRAGFWDPWIITDYTFVEISLVDHPMNYDAKRVADASGEGRSRMLFMRRDIAEEGIMSEEKDVQVQEEAPEEINETELTADVELAVVEEVPAEKEQADSDSVPVEEGGDPDSSQALEEALALISEKLDAMASLMELIHESLTPAPEEEKELDESGEEPVDEGGDVEQPADEGAMAILIESFKALSEKVDGICERFVEGDEAEPEDQSPADLERTLDELVERKFQELSRLRGRKTIAIPEHEDDSKQSDEVESKTHADPRQRLHDRVRRVFSQEETE
jgi:hypothetical protein